MSETEGRKRRTSCRTCGYAGDPAEYHPYAFCVLYKAGLDPWRELRIMAAQMGLKPDLPERPPTRFTIHEARKAIHA